MEAESCDKGEPLLEVPDRGRHRGPQRDLDQQDDGPTARIRYRTAAVSLRQGVQHLAYIRLFGFLRESGEDLLRGAGRANEYRQKDLERLMFRSYEGVEITGGDTDPGQPIEVDELLGGAWCGKER